MPAIKAGGTIYVSGQVGRRPDGNLAGHDITSQTRQVFENLKSALALAGAGFEHMTKITVFLTNEEEMSDMEAPPNDEARKGGTYLAMLTGSGKTTTYVADTFSGSRASRK